MSDSVQEKVVINPVIQDAIRLTGIEGHELSNLKFKGVDIVTGIEHVFSMRTEDTPPRIPQSDHHFTLSDLDETLCKKFKVLNVMGQGRFSTVYAAVDLKQKRKVALKVYRSSDEFLEYFNHEVNLLKRIEGKSHPNVVACHGHFTIQTKRGLHGVIIFDLVPNTIKNLLRTNKKGVPLKQAKHITNQVAKGLAFLHLHGLIHADIKPENLLIDDVGLVKICDIGSGCLADSVDSFRVGTIPYIAPEILLGCKYDNKADVWSLACLFFELATNSCPFDPEIYFKSQSDYGSRTNSTTSESCSSHSIEESDWSQASSSEDEDEFFDQEITHFQLCHFKKLLGDFPHDLFLDGIYYPLFFNSCKAFRVVPRYIDDRPLATVMIDDLDIAADDAVAIESECLKLLKLDPRERPVAADVFIK